MKKEAKNSSAGILAGSGFFSSVSKKNASRDAGATRDLSQGHDTSCPYNFHMQKT
jgi:hypothetical protein